MPAAKSVPTTSVLATLVIESRRFASRDCRASRRNRSTSCASRPKACTTRMLESPSLARASTSLSCACRAAVSRRILPAYRAIAIIRKGTTAKERNASFGLIRNITTKVPASVSTDPRIVAKPRLK
ncbi:MAG: hypothetical protein EBZ83_01470 [Verrucomicrobia bacterium]|nr:hypothetical protein [Verrucomicrobiota bacterium]